MRIILTSLVRPMELLASFRSSSIVANAVTPWDVQFTCHLVQPAHDACNLRIAKKINHGTPTWIDREESIIWRFHDNFAMNSRPFA